MEKKSLKILSIILATLLLLSVTTIAILATLLVVEKSNVIDFTMPDTEINQNKTYNLSNVNFKSTSDTNSNNIQSVNVIAKVKPFNATDKRLTWSIAWKDSNSEWATNKNPLDYVKIVVDEIDSRKASISMLNSFGEIIILTVSSVSNPEVTKSVEIRCIAELDFVTSFKFRDVTYSFNKDGFLDGSKELYLSGSYYNYPSDKIEDFDIKTTVYGSTSTNITEKPFVTFRYFNHSDFYFLNYRIIYTTDYNYLNDLNVKVPIEEENDELYLLPTSFINPDGINVGDEGDVSQMEHTAISLDYLVYGIIRNTSTKDIKYSYRYLELKFMGTGSVIKINMDCYKSE